MAKSQEIQEAVIETLQTRINETCISFQTGIKNAIALEVQNSDRENAQMLGEFTEQMLVSEVFRSINHWINSLKNKLKNETQENEK